MGSLEEDVPGSLFYACFIFSPSTQLCHAIISPCQNNVECTWSLCILLRSRATNNHHISHGGSVSQPS